MFSPTVRCGNKRRSWKTTVQSLFSGGSAVRSLPFRKTLPEELGMSPSTALIKVLFPQPLTPRRLKISPFFISKEQFFTIELPSKYTFRFSIFNMLFPSFLSLAKVFP